MMPFIKICGIRKYEHVRIAEANGALWYGLVFHKKSPRNIDLHDAKKIVRKPTSFISPVAVTVNPNESFIRNLKEIGIELGFKQIMTIEKEKGMNKVNNSSLEIARQDHAGILSRMKK